jgi:hypothetical protein
MEICGVMRLCDEFVEEIDLTIGAMAAHCDRVCFLADHVRTPEIMAAVERCDNCVGVQQYTERPWNQYRSLDRAYHFANSFGADWIVMQDQDELLPWAQLRRGLAAATEAGADTLVLPPIHCWDSPNRVVWPRLNVTANHGKAYRGHNPDWTTAGSGGCCLPGPPFVGFHWPFPYRHLGFMSDSCRARRLQTPPGRSRSEPWARTPPPVFPFREDWSIDRWMELEHDS